MHKVLISAPYMVNDIKLFEGELRERNIEIEIYPVRERLEESDLLPIIDQFDGIICGDDRFTPRVLDQATKLKAIVKWGTGIDSIDKPYAESKGIRVCNTLDAFSEPVSDSVLGIILAFTRKIFEGDRIMKKGGWEKAFGICLSEVSVGIIGLGNVGKSVARKIQPFNTTLYVNDIIDLDPALIESYKAKNVTLEELLRNSDFVLVCCDLNPTSEHLMNENTFAMMKDGSYIINTSRGPIIHEVAMVRALQTGKLAGAGLDVFEEEPLPLESPLRKMDNVILSSHNVNASPFYWNKVHRNSLDMLYNVLQA